MNTNLISRKNEFRIFLLLALTGLILRGLYLFEYAHLVNFDLAVGADTGEYHSRSLEILRGLFFPQTPEIHAPLYSFFLAGSQKIGMDIPGIRVFQTFLNYFSWIGLYFLLRAKELPEKCCFVFLGIAMVLAPLIFHSAELISESLLLPLLTGVFVAFYYAEKKELPAQGVFSALAGIFSALALLCHGMMTGFIVLESAFLFIRKKWFTGAFFLAGVIFVVAPFIIFKSCHYGKLTGIQGNSTFNMFLGNNPKATGLCYMRPGNLWRKTHFQALQTSRLRNISTNRYFAEKIAVYWKSSPLKGIGLYLQKCFLIFSGKEYIAGADGGFLYCRTDTINLLRFLTFPVIFLAFWGLWHLFKHKELFWSTPMILALSLFFMQLLTVTSGRYRFLMFPAIIYLAALGALSFRWKKYFLLFGAIFIVSVWKTYNFCAANKHESAALLGQAHFLKGNYEHARELLVFAQKRYKDSSRIDNLLGNIAEKANRPDLARHHYLKAAVEEPFMPEGWMNLANITPTPAEAEKYFIKALDAAGSEASADLTFNYGKFLYAVKRYSEAEKMAEKTLKKAPEHVMTLNLSGLLAAERKDFSKASEFFYRAATLAPMEAGYWRNTAITARLAGKKALEAEAARKYWHLIRKK